MLNKNLTNKIMEKEPKLVNTINKDELGIPKGVLIGLIGDNKQKTLYAVYEKTPAHGSKEHNVILSPFKTKEDAEQSRIKYGYNSNNYYVDILKYE